MKCTLEWLPESSEPERITRNMGRPTTNLHRLLLQGFVVFGHLLGCSEHRDSAGSGSVDRLTMESTETPPEIDAPKLRLERYLSDRLNGRWAGAFRLTKSRITEEAYVASSERSAPLAAILGAHSSFELLSVDQTESDLKATVRISMPDLTPVIQQMIMRGVKADMLKVPATYEPILDDLKAQLANGEITTVTQDQLFRMTLGKDNQWYVVEPDRRDASFPQ